MKKNVIVAIAFFLAIVTGIVSASADTISTDNCFAVSGTAAVEGSVCKGTFDQGLRIEIWLAPGAPVFSGDSHQVTVFRIKNETSPSFIPSWYEYKIGDGQSGKLESGEEFYGTTFGSVAVSAISQPWGFNTWGDESIPQLMFSTSASAGRYAVSQRVPEPATFVLFCVSALSVLYRMKRH